MQVVVRDKKGSVFEANIKEAILPTSEGEVTVMDFHQPIILRLGRGRMFLDKRDFEIRDGIALMVFNVLEIFIKQ